MAKLGREFGRLKCLYECKHKGCAHVVSVGHKDSPGNLSSGDYILAKKKGGGILFDLYLVGLNWK